MRTLIKSFFAIALLAGFVSCSDDDKMGASIFDIPQEPIILNTTDQYLYDTYQKPYNVEVIYSWRESETDMSFNLIPPYLEKVQPLMHVIDTTYVEPYDIVVGTNFLKRYVPKQFLLIGSPGINASSGTEVLGTAEGGVKVLLYKVNQFDRNNPATYEDILHTIHHEFAHILHQNKLYDRTYKDVTPSVYTATWYNYTDADANAKGCITAYAMASCDEDFSEMFSIMLLNGKENWDKMIEAMPAEGQKLIRSKEELIISYCETKWKFKFRDLQQMVYARISELAPVSTHASVVPFAFKSERTSCGCSEYFHYAPPGETPVEEYLNTILDNLVEKM